MKAIHQIAEVVHLSLHSLVTNAMRSVLTMLSILFGVWSVIAMLAINEGASQEAQRSLRELGSNNIIIETIPPPEGSSKASASARGAKNYGLTYLDAARLRNNIPNIVRSVVSHRTKMIGRVADRLLNVTVIGTEPIYAEIARIDLVAGRFISHADYLKCMPDCVITRSLARRFFPAQNPLGAKVLLGATQEPYTVVGVLDRLPPAMAGTGVDPDNCVIIPLSTDRTRMGELTVSFSQGSRTFERVEISQVILQMRDEKAVLAGATVARSLLERFRKDKDYKVGVPLELLEQQAKQRRLWNIMFTFIALISLLVGGIGIANIMLAGVTERTREIGVRRALGAKRRDITVQFLVESVTLTTVGGVLGIGMGLLIPFVIRVVIGLPAEPSLFMLVLPFVVAVVVGLISGLWPALRAARLDPIVALRHE